MESINTISLLKSLSLSSTTCFTIHCGNFDVFFFLSKYKLKISSGCRQWHQGDGRREVPGRPLFLPSLVNFGPSQVLDG